MFQNVKLAPTFSYILHHLTVCHQDLTLFFNLSIITRVNINPFITNLQNNTIILKKNAVSFSLKKQHRFYQYILSGLRIGKTRLSKETPLTGSENEIIKQIHTIRFNKNNPYIITGGHFSQLFVRNLGIFYNALLDPRIPCSDEDWLLRQEIGLKTVALDLEIFLQAKKDYTTIIPLQNNFYTCLNLYARPSDSLFAIVYTLNALSDNTFIEKIFPAKGLEKKRLQTQNASEKLLQIYKPAVKKLLQSYIRELIDPNTGLIKTDLLLASARDGIKRRSSFYDNVIAWATIRLANKLDLYDIAETELATWKQLIMQTFWNATEGIFIDDLSEDSKKLNLFSADSFIILSSGFLTVTNKKEFPYLKQMVCYVKKNKLDSPFPLHYSAIDQPNNLYRPVKYFAPSYMGTSIWSHWGMEYIKTLIILSQFGNEFGKDAKKHLESYKKNIVHYGGYPEVYAKNGEILKTRLYRSVLHNGWVINYEQTKMLLEAAK
jgi:hypothetical protein